LKRCLQCNSVFPDAENFCEVDGTLLVAVDAPNPLPVDSTGVVPHPKSSRLFLLIGALTGILLGVVLSLVYFAMSRQTAQENSNTASSRSSAQEQEVARPLQPAAPATGSPSVEPSVEPSPSPSLETPSPQNSSAPVESSSNPISTAADARGSGPVVIKLHSGLTIEADEAWQTGEGIWYLKQGVVSLLNPKNVKAIEKVSPPAPQPSASASPSP
jgi:cytoskeletal protein RodZ